MKPRSTSTILAFVVNSPEFVTWIGSPGTPSSGKSGYTLGIGSSVACPKASSISAIQGFTYCNDAVIPICESTNGLIDVQPDAGNPPWKVVLQLCSPLKGMEREGTVLPLAS